MPTPSLPLQQHDDGTWELDCLGMLCPVPIIKTGRAIRQVPLGAVLEVLADDPGARLDLEDWCSANRQELVSSEEQGSQSTTRIRRSR